jgi:hypothetical protein
MTTLNCPDKITLDAFSDLQLRTQSVNGKYNRFTNNLQTPILNAKGIQLLNANFINAGLPLLDDTAHLLFFYKLSGVPSPTASPSGSLQCVRLHPSNFVPFAGFTAYTLNRNFETTADIVSALNTAASAGGDSTTFNPLWIPDAVVFAVDSVTGKVTIASKNTLYITPCAYDDPDLVSYFNGTLTYTTDPPYGPIKMNSYNSGNAYISAPIQQWKLGQTMTQRLGFSISYFSPRAWAIGGATASAANQLGVFTNGTALVADSLPILIGTQNVSVYLSIAGGSGIDASGRKNLIQTIPIEVGSQKVNSYTTSSVEKPALSIPTEIYTITAELLDDQGRPFYQPGNYNLTLAFSVYY